jgi:hypothetical protein
MGKITGLASAIACLAMSSALAQVSDNVVRIGVIDDANNARYSILKNDRP